MSTATADEDDWDEDEEEDEGEGEDTIPCPHCRRQIYDGAERCPNCGEYISIEDGPRERKPIWIVATCVVCLVVALFWVLSG